MSNTIEVIHGPCHAIVVYCQSAGDSRNNRDPSYIMGERKANHPVPAITTGCVFFNSYVTINRYNGRDGFFGPGYESVHIWGKPNA